MNRLRVWLRSWLWIIRDQKQLFDELRALEARQLKRIEALEAEVVRLKVAQYVPPQQPPEEKVRVIRTQNFKQYQDILEQEFAQKEE